MILMKREKHLAVVNKLALKILMLRQDFNNSSLKVR